MSGRVETGPSWELREGRWEDVLADVERVDAVITDPPYSERTHKGHNALEAYDASGAPRDNRVRLALGLKPLRKRLNYAAWGATDVGSFVAVWAGCDGWVVAFSDHCLATAWGDAFNRSGRLAFAPLACVEIGSRVRMAGDGPAQWACLANVARPRSVKFARWGALPGAYVVPAGHGDGKVRTIPGAKPLWLMRALVRDYSRPGDLICDPCAGSGTTLLAAVTEGRRAIGAEMDPETFDLAVRRLRKGYTPAMDFGGGA